MALSDILGFSFGKKKGKEVEGDQSIASPMPPEDYDGSYLVETGGVYGTYIDFTGNARDDGAFIAQYRNMSLYPEVDTAIDEIVNETIVLGTDRKPIKLQLDKLNLSDSIKSKIHKEFDHLLKILDFKGKCYEIFRRWYIDGKIYYYIEIDNDNPQQGIRKLIPLDPIKIKKIKNLKKNQKRVGSAIVPLIQEVEEYYLYTDTNKDSLISTGPTGLRLSTDSICYAHSGLVDMNTKRVVGYLQKAIRTMNMLRQLEDAIVVYRISRAPERRIFYIDVGNLPKQKAEQYVRELMNRYRNRMIYNQATGEIKDDRNHMAMLEDYWMPRREGGRGTEISTLDGGQNLGEMTDVEYFKRKLYQSLNIPASRLAGDNQFNMGRSAEITRDEVKFFKFIERIRLRFSVLFLNLLKVQLVLKGIITVEDWDDMYSDIEFEFNTDSYFNDIKDAEVLASRLDLVAAAEQYIGKYFSTDYIRKNILKQSDEEIELINTQMQFDILKMQQAAAAQQQQMQQEQQ